MNVKLTKDFKDNTQIREMPCERDPMGLYFQIHLMGHEMLGKNYYLERSNWDSFMITYTKTGHTNVVVDNTIYLANEGTFIFLDCMRPHISWVDEPKKPNLVSCEHYYIHLYPTDALRNLYSIITRGGNVIHLNKDLGFINLVNTLISKYDKGEYDDIEASEMIYHFLLKFEKESQKITNKEKSIPSAVKEALFFIVKNYQQKLTVESIAQSVNFAPNYLEFLFTKYLKMPILKYLQHYRFQKASDLLLTTNLSVADIAVEVGLNDSQTLIRLFKAKVNTTPKQYRGSKR